MSHPSFHRRVLHEAWSTAWSHKRLWLLGVLASLVNTGSVIDVVWRSFHRLSPEITLRTALANSAPWAGTALLYVQKLRLVDSFRLGITVMVIFCSIILLGLLALCAQAALINQVAKGKRPHAPLALIRHPSALIGHLLTLNVWARAAMILASFATGFLMAALRTHTVSGDALVNFGLLLLFVPTALFVSYLSLFGAMEICLRGKGVKEAINDATQVLKKHYLLIGELSIILFLVNLAVTGGIIGSLTIIAVPYLLSLQIAAASGSGFLWLGTMIVGTMLLSLLCLSLLGLLTTFVYAAWYHAYKRLAGPRKMLSKLEQLIRAFL